MARPLEEPCVPIVELKIFDWRSRRGSGEFFKCMYDREKKIFGFGDVEFLWTIGTPTHVLRS